MDNDEEMMAAVVGGEEWLRLTGSAADARQRGIRMRRTRYAGIGGATAAVVAVAAVTATSFPGGTSHGATRLGAATGSNGTASAPTSSAPLKATPKPGTLAELYEQAKACPESFIGKPNPADKTWLSVHTMYVGECKLAMTELPRLLPGLDVAPMVSLSNSKWTDPHDGPGPIPDLDYVVPAGTEASLSTTVFRVSDGKTSQILGIQSSLTDPAGQPAPGPGVSDITLPGGFVGKLKIDPNATAEHESKYVLWVQDARKVTITVNLGGPQDSAALFDFGTFVHDPGFATYLGKLAAGTVDTRVFV